MRIITFVTQKGGAGKTTLTVNCAVAAERTKKKELILELDTQASAESWYQDRDAETPKLVRIGPWPLPEAISRARTAGFDICHDRHPRTRRAGHDACGPAGRFLGHPMPTHADGYEGNPAYRGNGEPPAEASGLRDDPDTSAWGEGSRSRSWANPKRPSGLPGVVVN
jgi:chromosome partitioning protein